MQGQGVKPTASQVYPETQVGAKGADENVPRARPAADLHRGEERAVPFVHQLQDQHEVHRVSSPLRYVTQILQLRSRVCFRKQLERELETSYTGHEVLQEIANKEEALWAKCVDVNDEWNAEVALARDARLALEREAEREIILAQLINKEEEKKQHLEAIEQIVRLEKVMSCIFMK